MNINEIKTHQREFLNKAKTIKKPIVYLINGLKIIVNPGVFPPATDTILLTENIFTSPRERVLDITTGSGVYSIIAGLQGASGTAVDINPKAVKNAEENIKKYRVKFNVIESNLFNKVPNEQFDQIFANGPFFEGEITDFMDYACYGARGFMERLLMQLRNYLKPTGKLLIVLSAWSDLKRFKKIIKKNNLIMNLIATKKSDDGKRTYNLYEVKITE